jgi:hypothetical protein
VQFPMIPSLLGPALVTYEIVDCVAPKTGGKG